MAKRCRRSVQIYEEDYKFLSNLRKEFGIPLISIHETLLFDALDGRKIRKSLDKFKKKKR